MQALFFDQMTTIITTYKELLADTITPVQLFLNVRDQFANSLLLESSEYQNKENSFSYICLNPIAEFCATGNKFNQRFPGEPMRSTNTESAREIGEAFKTFVENFTCEGKAPLVPVQGLFGYTSFEAVQYFEDITFKETTRDSKQHPDLRYQFFEYVIAIDHFHNSLYILHNADSKLGNTPDFKHIESLIGLRKTNAFRFCKVGRETSTIDDETYKQYVQKGIDHCQQGDVFQVVLSREFQQAFQGDDFNVYRTVRSINPSPYLFYFDYSDYRIFGSSPESQLQVIDGKGIINPIAGTVRRTGNRMEDTLKAEALRADPKETSEHTMLVDLARNDLSRFATDVTVDAYAEVQNFSHVIHLVSTVSGMIYDDHSPIDVFGGTFPAGTLSGAPKYRALQIIDENEPHRRNFYGGAIGYFGFDGTVNHAIIIRSILSKNNVLTYQAGAGVVIESTPDGELQEVNNKVAAMRSAIDKAEQI